MTAVVGLVHGGDVHLGADSAGIAGYEMTVRADTKVFTNGPYALGFTTSFRMGQLLRYALEPPTPTGDLHRFMCTEFVDAVRDCLKAGGYAKKENDVEAGGSFLVGVGGRLFEIGVDYQVGETADGYAAVGCGDDVARGVLYATPNMAAHARVVLALQGAEHHSAGVRGPFAFASAAALIDGGDAA